MSAHPFLRCHAVIAVSRSVDAYAMHTCPTEERKVPSNVAEIVGAPDVVTATADPGLRYAVARNFLLEVFVTQPEREVIPRDAHGKPVNGASNSAPLATIIIACPQIWVATCR